MSTLASSAKYLSEKGLQVNLITSDKLCVGREGDRAIDIGKREGGYSISSWEYTPGPGEEDFLLVVPTLDEALLIAWCYYFAKNIEIAGWELPLHRRPYWSLPKVQYQLENAAHISANRLEEIRESRRQKILSNPSMKGCGLGFADHTQFILAGRHGQSGSFLFLRRDLNESYVVVDA